MPKRNSTVKIVDGKVVFSKEILEYFESIRNEENSAWIDKYFEYLSDENNLTATKYSGHHIIPCFTFKDETHKNRKETEPLADKIEGNIIKLSVHNHLLAHHCLWKIYNNRDSKTTIQRMCKEDVDDLSENEIKEIAKIQEECAKENRTKEEFKEYQKRWYEENKERKLKKNKEWGENNKELCAEYSKHWHEEHREEILKRNKELYKENRDIRLQKNKEYNEKNKEKIKMYHKKYNELHKEEQSEYSKEHYQKNKEKYQKQHKEYYENNKEEISRKNKERYQNNKDEISKKHKEYNDLHKEDAKRRYEENRDEILKYKKVYYEENKQIISEKDKKYKSQQCYDPKRENFCTLGALIGRKYRNKEEYQNVIPRDCIIKDDESSHNTISAIGLTPLD